MNCDSESGLTPADARGEVSRADPTTDETWDARIAANPRAAFFHGAAWARVLKDTYGYAPCYFCLGAAGSGAFVPFMEVESWLTGRRGISLPFTDECIPAASDDDLRTLHPHILEYASFRKWKHVEFRGAAPALGAPEPSLSFLGHNLDLTRSEKALYGKLDDPVRRAIRKATKEGVTVRFSRELSDVGLFYDLLCKTRKRHGVPPQPFEFFRNIHRHVLSQGKGWVVLAQNGSAAVAGAVFFEFKNRALFKFGASDEAFQGLRPNNLVMWEAIRHYRNEGFDDLDFGRTSVKNKGLQKFKLSWGTTERRIDYVRQDCRTGRFLHTEDGAEGRRNRLFEMMPESFLRLIGRLAYKHVA